jgi:hypothetical protein
MRGLVIPRVEPLEAVLLILFGGFAAVFLILSKDYNSTAALFPRCVAIVSLLSLAALIVQLFSHSVRSSRASDKEIIETSAGAVSRPMVFGLQGAYILFIYVLGFFAATLLFLLIAPIQLRYKRWRVVVVQGLVVTLVVAGSFLWLFGIQLPAGVIWDVW